MSKPIVLLLFALVLLPGQGHSNTFTIPTLDGQSCATLVSAKDSDKIRIGTTFEVQQQGQEKITAYFAGKRGTNLYFATKAGFSNFRLSVDEKTAEPFQAVAEAPPAGVLECSPQSVLTCLKQLDLNRELPEHLHRRLAEDPQNLYEEMVNLFSLEAMHRTLPPTNGKAVDSRADQHGRIIEWLKENGLYAEVTHSGFKFLWHLESGGTAVASSWVIATGAYWPELGNVKPSVPWNDPDLFMSTLPAPRWAPAAQPPHAVAAFGTTPHISYMMGRGILVLDSLHDTIQVWPFNFMLMFRARYILIYPSPI